MATETEQLVVSLEARIRDFEKNFNKASRTADQNFDKIEKRSKMATNRLAGQWASMGRTFAGVGKNLAAGLIGGLVAGGVLGISGRLNDVARSVASIGDEARRAGLGLTEFQELKYVAEQNRLGVDSLVDGIKELNLRADEFITTGAGSGAEAFGRLGYTAQDLATKLQDPSALFTEIIGKLGQLDRAAQIRIADEIFGGTGGERFVQLIDQGADGIRDTIDEAHELGLIMDEDLIAAADELDRKFSAISATVGTGLKTAIVEAAGALGDFINAFNGFIADWSGANDVGAGFDGNQPWSQLLTDEQYNRMANLDLPLASLRNPQTNFYEGFDFGPDGNMVLAPPPAPPAPVITLPSTGGSGGGGGGGRSASSMREQRDAAAELIKELENELAVLGMSELEQRVNEELRRAGTSATDDQKNSIRELVMAIETESGAMERLESATENAKGMAKDFLGGLVSDLRNGVDGATALGNAFGRLADRLMDMALSGIVDALFANLSGGLFSFLKFKEGGVVEAANGGFIRGPGTGTSDSIPARLSDGEYVVNARATSRNLDLLEAINSGRLAAFATGGLAGSRLSTGRDRANVNIGDINITTQGSSGDPAKDREHAAMIAKQVDQMLEKKMAAWAMNQTRNGGMFAGAGR